MDSYDYILIGAGTAGCVVAARLAERGARVLLLEAGGTDRRFWVQLPIGYGRTFNDPSVNWMYQAEPDRALGDRRAFWPRGKLLGGSGSINAMVFVRGLPQDYDDWHALGNPGWAFGDLKPFFERAESVMPLCDVSGDAHLLTRAYLESCRGLGFSVTDDFNGPQSEGVGLYRFTTRAGFRASTAKCYLRPALQQPSLHLRLRAHVLRILIEHQRAVGVRFAQAGRTLEARAGKSVILCAGAVNSPQLLQLSGIGPAALLQRHGIPIESDSPAVGLNLQDHLSVSYCFRSTVPTFNDELYPWRGKLKAAMRYVLTRRGPLAVSLNQGGGFVRSDASQPRANLQLYFNPMSFTTAPGPDRRLLKPDPFPAFLLSFSACRPSSRGRLQIRSADPFEAPSIHPNSLSTEHDVSEAIAGARLLRNIAATAPLSRYVESELLPGVRVQSDPQLLADFRARAGTIFHPVGTCRMGPDPAAAVVDARLRVYGVAALRIVDASVFPTITSGNTNAPTIMLAEKAAAMVIEDEIG